MKSAGDSHIRFAVPEKAMGESRKALRAWALRGFTGKKGKKLMMCVRCNLIMPAAVGAMNIMDWLKSWTAVQIRQIVRENSVLCRFFSLSFCDVVCVFGSAEDDEFPPDEFADKVCQHGDSLDEVFVQSGIGGYLAQPGGDGNKEYIEDADLEHGNGNIVGRFEGIAAVECEVVQNRKDDGYDMLPVVGHRCQKIEQDERGGLDQSGAQRQESELDCLNQSFIWFLHFESPLNVQ